MREAKSICRAERDREIDFCHSGTKMEYPCASGVFPWEDDRVFHGIVHTVSPLSIRIFHDWLIEEENLVVPRHLTDHTVSFMIDDLTELDGSIQTVHKHTFSYTDKIGNISGTTEAEGTGTTDNTKFDTHHRHKFVGTKNVTVLNALKVGEKVIMLREPGSHYWTILDKISINCENMDYHDRTANNFAGIEYEQMHLDLPNLILPVINNVTTDTLDPVKGIYKLSVSKYDCTLDSRSAPFFFFKAEDGTFSNFKTDSNGSTTVIFRANPDTESKNIWVEVGVGDSLGQTYRRSILIKGDN